MGVRRGVGLDEVVLVYHLSIGVDWGPWTTYTLKYTVSSETFTSILKTVPLYSDPIGPRKPH